MYRDLNEARLACQSMVAQALMSLPEACSEYRRTANVDELAERALARATEHGSAFPCCSHSVRAAVRSVVFYARAAALREELAALHLEGAR